MRRATPLVLLFVWACSTPESATDVYQMAMDLDDVMVPVASEGDSATDAVISISDSTPDVAMDGLLVNLSVSVGALNEPFAPDILNYTADALFEQTETTITATGDGAVSEIRIRGLATASGEPSAPIALLEGSNPVSIEVDNADGSGTTLYFVDVTREGAPEFAHQAFVKASNTDEDDLFGGSVALDGDTLAVGARWESSDATGINGNQNNNSEVNSGAVYVYTRDGLAWSQQAYIKASNTDSSDWFGGAIALDGDTLVVGAELEDSSATGIDSDQVNNDAFSAGAVYVFTRSGDVWSQQAYLKASNTDGSDNFGSSVSLDGDTLAVGANDEESGATGVDGNEANNAIEDSGAVYIFARTGTTWSQQAYIKASNTGEDDIFGYSTSIDGDTLVVGAPNEQSGSTGIDGNQSHNGSHDAGAAYVFTRTADVWSQQAYVKASNTDNGDSFGWSVAIDGDTIAVGAFGEDSSATGADGYEFDNSEFNSGAAYVFTRIGTTWSQQAYLKANNTEAGDQLGWSLDLDGDLLVVGANNEDGDGSDPADDSLLLTGGAFVFAREGETWSFDQYLKASNPRFGDLFGESVAIDDGWLAVGAIGEESQATGIDGNENDDTMNDAGAVYVFER